MNVFVSTVLWVWGVSLVAGVVFVVAVERDEIDGFLRSIVCRCVGHRPEVVFFSIDFWICGRCYRNGGTMAKQIDRFLASEAFATEMREAEAFPSLN